MPLEMRTFGRMPDDTEVRRVELCHPGGPRAVILSYGAILKELWVPDAAGRLGNVVLGAETLTDYREGFQAPAAVIGRVANRIANSRFTLDGVEYALPPNDGRHHLHGGPGGFARRVWRIDFTAVSDDELAVGLELVSEHGDQGYPGRVEVRVGYVLRRDSLQLDYRAVTDRPTPINLTHHAYFNLGDSPDVLDHVLQVEADRYTPVDHELIPTGEIAPVDGTPLDFRVPARLGDRVQALKPWPGGCDHNLVLRDDALRAATLTDPSSRRVLTVYTTEPGLQLYTGNFLQAFTGPGGRLFLPHGGVCLETQHFPDAVNHPEFPPIWLRPGEVFESGTTFSFSNIR